MPAVGLLAQPVGAFLGREVAEGLPPAQLEPLALAPGGGPTGAEDHLEIFPARLVGRHDGDRHGPDSCVPGYVSVLRRSPWAAAEHARMEKTQRTRRPISQDRARPTERFPQPRFSCLCPVFFAFFPATPRSPR
jgi:hypothetical protein